MDSANLIDEKVMINFEVFMGLNDKRYVQRYVDITRYKLGLKVLDLINSKRKYHFVEKGEEIFLDRLESMVLNFIGYPERRTE